MICKRCGQDKPETEFYRDKTVKSGFMSKCKECTKSAVRQRYFEKKEEIKEYHKKHNKEYRDRRLEIDAQYKEKVMRLKTPCVKCGENRLYVIDFHHINPGEKSFNINRKSGKLDFSIIENEVNKCVCLCRNCHAEFHYLYGLQPQNPIEALNEYLGKGS